MSKIPNNLKDFQALVEITQALRDPNDGCPWDLEQNHQSLTQYALEEVCEYIEAVEMGDLAAMKDELGDVLLQVTLNAEIARQENMFTIEDVIENISQKMIRRHPHVFSDSKIKDSSEVIKNWDKIKEQENSNKVTSSPFDLPTHLPALMAAFKIGKKSKKFNFDWNKPQEVLSKVEEEISELKEAIQNNDLEHIKEEIGDVLFSVAQLSRHLQIEPEEALRASNRKFKNRFDIVQSKVLASNKSFEDHSIDELEFYWKEAKKDLKK